MDSNDIWKELYVNQMIYLNTRVLELVDHILRVSEIQPIIIIQGDHGIPIFERRYYQHNEILNAYYLPSIDVELLYPNISPVNSFRTIFNIYFDTNLELLKDVAFTSQWLDSPYQFEPVEEHYSQCLQP